MKIWLKRPKMDDLHAVHKNAHVFRVPLEEISPRALYQTVDAAVAATRGSGPWYALEVTSGAAPLAKFEWTEEALQGNFLIGPTNGTLEPEELALMDGVIRVEQFDSGYLSTVGVASILMYQAFMAGPNRGGQW